MTYWKLERPSKHSGKKWQVRVPTLSGRGKTVAFGDASMEDYTIHKDKARRENYRSRHRKDRIYDPYAPGYWSWWSLWGESSNLKTAHAAAVRMAKKLLKKKGVDVSGRSNPEEAPIPTMAEVAQVIENLQVPKNLRAEFISGFGVEWEHAHTVNYDLNTIGRIVIDHLAETPRYYRKLKRARLNPQPSERVRACFDSLLSVVHEHYPDLVCHLTVSEDAGLRGGERCTRAYAYCTDSPEGSFIVHVAPKIEDADDSRIDGLMRHELSHAVLLHTGDLEHTERDADEIAEDLFGAPLYYDTDDVQTTDPSAPGARSPRPEYLDDETGRTLDSAHPVDETTEEIMRHNGETMRLETVDDVVAAIDDAAAVGNHKTPRIIASQLSQQAKETAGPQSRMLMSLARAARHRANAIEARLAGNIEHAMSCERLSESAIEEAQAPERKNPKRPKKRSSGSSDGDWRESEYQKKITDEDLDRYEKIVARDERYGRATQPYMVSALIAAGRRKRRNPTNLPEGVEEQLLAEEKYYSSDGDWRESEYQKKITDEDLDRYEKIVARDERYGRATQPYMVSALIASGRRAQSPERKNPARSKKSDRGVDWSKSPYREKALEGRTDSDLDRYEKIVARDERYGRATQPYMVAALIASGRRKRRNGARYAGETARDLYQGASEAHGEYDEVEEHEAEEDVLPGTRSNPRSEMKYPSASEVKAAKRLVAKMPKMPNHVKAPSRLKAYQKWADLVLEEEALPAKVRALAKKKKADDLDNLINIIFAISYGDVLIG